MNLRAGDPPIHFESATLLTDPALTPQDWQYLRRFHALIEEKQRMGTCGRCRERWFDMGLDDNDICARCRRVDKTCSDSDPGLYSAENYMNPGHLLTSLPQLTSVEEMLIARVHVFIDIRQVRGQQFKYKGHVVNFLQNTGRIYNTLPLLPRVLDVVLIRPFNATADPQTGGRFSR
jgi:hypothetical protein